VWDLLNPKDFANTERDATGAYAQTNQASHGRLLGAKKTTSIEHGYWLTSNYGHPEHERWGIFEKVDG
jgi:hypothetical protein